MKHFKPFDIVSDEDGNVAFVKEIDVTQGLYQYSLTWITGGRTKVAWFDCKELTLHCNLFERIAESSCSQSSTERMVSERLWGNR